MKADTNDFATIRTGPNAVPPNVVVYNGPVRNVIQTRVFRQGFIFSSCTRYMTLPKTVLTAGVTAVGPNGYFVDTKRAHRVVFASNPLAVYVVALVEEITPYVGDTYTRLSLVLAGSPGYPV